VNTSPPLDHFRQQYFGPYDHYLGWHDGYDADLTALDALTPADRATAEAELCTALRTGRPDPRVILGLGHLRSRAALPLLHDYLPKSGIYVLGAIAQIDPNALQTEQLLTLLTSPKIEESDLFGMVMGLGSYFTLPQLAPRIIQQLIALLANRHYLVRVHTLDTLRRLYHLPSPKDGDGKHTTRADVLSDELFCLIVPDRKSADFRRAQQLLQAQIAALTPPPSSGASPA
jgi:hypothetical protein